MATEQNWWQLFLERFSEQLAGTGAMELVAVVAALLYLLLAMAEKRACWYFALLSTTIYTVIFWQVSLLMESALNVYYIAMAIYGWWQWRPGNSRAQQSVAIHRWAWPQHAMAIALVLLLSLASGYGLSQYSEAAFPYLDSFTTWGAVITTFMVARKVLENWLYWLVINGTSMFLFVDRGLLFTVGLLALYQIIVVIGYIHWRRAMVEHHSGGAAHA